MQRNELQQGETYNTRKHGPVVLLDIGRRCLVRPVNKPEGLPELVAPAQLEAYEAPAECEAEESETIPQTMRRLAIESFPQPRQRTTTRQSVKVALTVAATIAATLFPLAMQAAGFAWKLPL